MAITVEGKALCKINIFLKILGIMPEGYHDLYMLMQQTGLGDDMKVTIETNGSGSITLTDIPGLDMQDNLCYKAARAYLQAASLDWDVDISLTKNVPSGAGLGGGSSDAAFVLKALDDNADTRLPSGELEAIALSLGADIPFFLYGGAALCEGKGERLTQLPPLSGLYLLLVKPPESINTGECYRKSDEIADFSFDAAGYKARTKEIFSKADISAADRIRKAMPYLTNDLQAPAELLLPRVKGINEAIAETGSFFSMMTGSGSCVYGLFEEEEAMTAALASLSERPELKDCTFYATCLV